MKITPHIKAQIEHAQGAGIDLETLSIANDESGQPYLEDEGHDPVPPGTPPPVPPM